MSKVIASTYEIEEEIGSGGSGIVYRARHLRLGKTVVLKADKRTLATRTEVLRTEVDILKNLNHPCIPRVYDFLEEDGIVYTVMDYIEGESLDKPLRRGERFSQAQVIEWGCKILSALQYMHAQPPHGILHGDIKPANIMLTSDGDIRLIDFNIALALGEDRAVVVGHSLGYASPEHYGITPGGTPKADRESVSAAITKFPTTASAETVIDETFSTETQIDDTAAETVVDGENRTETVVGSTSVPTSSGSLSGSRTIVLDVRSDIYSLGATLYHLLTGRRPAKNATDVEPIPRGEYSPELVAIIEKAMQPDATLRYQSADEMLWALEHIRENDPRAVRFRRIKKVSAAVLTAVFLCGAFLAFTGLRQMQQTEKSHALAEYAENALRNGDRGKAVSLALQAFPAKSIFVPPYTPQAQTALSDALGVYDLSDGFKLHGNVSQATQTMKLTLSPSGKTGAALCLGELTLFDTESGGTLAKLKTANSALADASFLGDDTLIYAGSDGLTAYGISAKKTLWTAAPALKLAVSADGQTIAATGKEDDAAVLYDAAGRKKGSVSFGGKKLSAAVNDSFGDPGDILFKLSSGGNFLAVSFADGSLTAFDTSGGGNDLTVYDTSEYTHFEGGFSGQYLAYAATGSGGSQFAVIDTAAAEETGGFDLSSKIGCVTDESGIYLSNQTTVVKIDPVSGDQQELAYTSSDVTSFCHTADFTLVLTKDNAWSIFDKTAKQIVRTEGAENANRCAALSGGYALLGGLDSPDVRILKLENHADAQVFSYDPVYDHDELRLNAAGDRVMLFSYTGFRLCGTDGTFLRDVSIPDAEQVYDQQYRRDEKGSRLEVTYNDGSVLSYSGDTGELIGKTQGKKPDGSLTETFETDRLKIVSPLHGAPVVYDRKSGKKLHELKEDAYLTYVTQVGENVVTEYITDDGSRYGLVLDKNCETIAKLPNLCDIRNGELYFDYRSGSVRKAHIYTTDELLALARKS